MSPLSLSEASIQPRTSPVKFARSPCTDHYYYYYYRSPRYLNNPEYSKFDDHGVPTHDAAGAELNKTLYKKLKKDMEIAQKKLSKKK